MLQIEELRLQLLDIKPDIEALKKSIGYEAAIAELSVLEEQSMDPNFWGDLENSQKVLQQISRFKAKTGEYNTLYSRFSEALELAELSLESGEDSLYPDIKNGYDWVVGEYERQRVATLLSGEYDAKNAILTFHAGAGGTEAQDWAQMLYRMYMHWADGKGFSVKLLDYLDGDEAGLKSASILISGENAYGLMRSESGVHRLVRVSPFDSSGRRHTSFASIEVMPEIDNEGEVEIREEDLKIDTYRAGGAGGQHVNKTESAVRITHLPTGIVCACQNERSQHQNKDVAMKMLRSKLIEIKEREHLDRIEDIKGDQASIGWGSQIRSYVFMPYTLAKDHRTGFENGNINAVMDGELDGFINAYLSARSRGELKS